MAFFEFCLDFICGFCKFVSRPRPCTLESDRHGGHITSAAMPTPPPLHPYHVCMRRANCTPPHPCEPATIAYHDRRLSRSHVLATTHTHMHIHTHTHTRTHTHTPESWLAPASAPLSFRPPAVPVPRRLSPPFLFLFFIFFFLFSSLFASIPLSFCATTGSDWCKVAPCS